MNDTADDGQHRQAAHYSSAMLNVDIEGMTLLARHYMTSKQCKPDDPEASVPVTFTVDKNDQTLATVICGVCNRELGTCKVAIV